MKKVGAIAIQKKSVWQNCIISEGFAQGKITEADFQEREEKMVVGYWNRGS